MRSSEPPVLATWLLEHVPFSNSNDALAGDLLEDFQQRRSVAWYWRQVFAAILVGFVRDVRNHWVLAIRAAVIGLAVNCGALVLGHEVLVNLYWRGVLNPAFFPPFAGWIAESCFSGAASGLIVGLAHRKYRNAMLLALAGPLLLWAFTLRGTILTPRDSPQFVFEALTFYVSALAGVFIGGILISLLPKSGTPHREQHPAC